jgi:hypothetical protein
MFSLPFFCEQIQICLISKRPLFIANRTAIEEELELLYDAYYDELEQYANQQQPSDGHALTYAQHAPAFEEDELSDESRGSDEEDDEDDEDEDEDEDEDDEDEDEEEDDEYEDEEDEEEYEDEISNRQAPFPYRSGFPNTLQAKGMKTPKVTAKFLLQVHIFCQLIPTFLA